MFGEPYPCLPGTLRRRYRIRASCSGDLNRLVMLVAECEGQNLHQVEVSIYDMFRFTGAVMSN